MMLCHNTLSVPPCFLMLTLLTVECLHHVISSLRDVQELMLVMLKWLDLHHLALVLNKMLTLDISKSFVSCVQMLLVTQYNTMIGKSNKLETVLQLLLIWMFHYSPPLEPVPMLHPLPIKKPFPVPRGLSRPVMLSAMIQPNPGVPISSLELVQKLVSAIFTKLAALSVPTQIWATTQNWPFHKILC